MPWAFRGLLDGGAMVDTTGGFDAWKFWCPWEDPKATPENPYSVNLLATGDILAAKWHYIIPEKQSDPESKTDRAWTAVALKNAIASGRAVALNVGQVIMLGGDNFEVPSEMLNDADRWKQPRNIMRVYWDARRWIEGRIKAVSTGSGEVYEWQDYRHRYGVVYLVLELLMSNPSVLEDRSTVDEMESVAKGEGAPDVPVPPTAPRTNEGEAEYFAETERKLLKYAFSRFKARAGKVDAMVDLIRKASGASRYTEMHFYAQVLTGEAKAKGGTLDWMKSRLPWLTHLDPRGDLAKGGFDETDIRWFETNGIDDQVLQIIGSNGYYADLGFKNWTHFSENGLNFKTFEAWHRKALALVADHAAAPDSTHPIPARALFLTAFGCHFYTDAFSASHMRVPRRRLGAFSAKLMHDIDGIVGLWVHDTARPEPNIWYAFGDTYLHARTLNNKQRSLLPHRFGRVEVDPQINFDYAAAAAGSAFKQLHYQAHSVRQTESKPPGKAPPSLTVARNLDLNGPRTYGSFGDPPEKRDLKNILSSESAPADLTKAAYLRNETLAPGRAGWERMSIWEMLRMNPGDRIEYLESLVPHPLPTAAKMQQFRYGSPSSIHNEANIPPLFTKDATLNSAKDGPYDIVTAAGGWPLHSIRGLTHYAGFSLRVNWGPFGDFDVDDAELRLNYDKYYFMMKFFKDVAGLEDITDKTLLDVYNKLAKEYN